MQQVTVSAKYLGGEYRIPALLGPERLVMGGRDAVLRIETGAVELSVKDSYNRGYDTIRYTKDDLLCSTRVANLWQAFGIDLGKQPVSLKVRPGEQGGAIDVSLVFPNKDDAFAFNDAMREAGLPTFRVSLGG
jgi:hypothetical protein